LIKVFFLSLIYRWNIFTFEVVAGVDWLFILVDVDVVVIAVVNDIVVVVRVAVVRIVVVVVVVVVILFLNILLLRTIWFSNQKLSKSHFLKKTK